MFCLCHARLCTISIHVPREGHDVSNSASIFRKSISIHVPREGHDQPPLLCCRPLPYFNPRAPRGARLKDEVNANNVETISIHVPREGHDCIYLFKSILIDNISIHVPREGHDRALSAIYIMLRIFQSTCPARGTTV